MSDYRTANDLRAEYRRALAEPEPGSIMTLTEQALNNYLYGLTGWRKSPPYKGQRYADHDWIAPDGKVHDCEYGGCPPDFAYNADDALTLIPPPNIVMLARAPDIDNQWDCAINSISSRLSDTGNGRGETPALAVCRAYIDWRNNQSKHD